MRAQDLHLALLFHRPTNGLLELLAILKCIVPISLCWTLYDKFSRSLLGTSANSEITDLVLELPVNVLASSLVRELTSPRLDWPRFHLSANCPVTI